MQDLQSSPHTIQVLMIYILAGEQFSGFLISHRLKKDHTED